MSELVVVIAVCGSSLVLTGLHALRSSRSDAAPHDLERLLAAVQRACADFLWQETRLLALIAGILLAAVAAAAAMLGALGSADAVEATAHAGGNVPLAWSLGGLCAGALAGAGVAHFAHWSGTRSAQAALGALRHDRSAATRVALRGASLLSVAIDAASSALSTLLFAAQYAYLTVVAQLPPERALQLSTRSLAALAFGGLCAAVVFQAGGASLHTAAGVASTGVRARSARIARDEEQNPVLVAELVGHHVGGLVSRSTDTFAGLLLANAGLCILAGLVGASNIGAGESGVAWVALPLVIRTLGQFSASVALGSARFEGQPGVTEMLVAARLSHALLLIAAVFGTTAWLLGAPLYTQLGLAGALGVLAGLLSAGASFAGVSRRKDGPALPGRSGPSVARAFGLGLQRTWLLLSLVGVCLGAAWLVGVRTGLQHGGPFALGVAVAALLGAGAFNSSESVFAALSENVQRFASLRRAELDAAARSRALELDRAGIAIGYLGHTQTILSGAAAALLAAVALPLLGAASGNEVSLMHPIVLMGGVLGAGSLLFHVGGMLKASSRTADSLDQGLSERVSREPGATRSEPPEGPLPGYRDSVQLAASSATQALLPLSLGAVLVPFSIAVVLRLVYGAGGGPVVSIGLMAFSGLGILTGSLAALVAQGTCLELRELRRQAAALGHDLSGQSNSVVEFMERCIGPAALLGLKATVVSALATVPLLF